MIDRNAAERLPRRDLTRAAGTAARPSRPGSVLSILLGLGLTATGIVPAASQEEAPPSSPGWTGSGAVYGYYFPDDEDYLLPVAVAERDRLHLEARYNYEDRNTGSIFGGWKFETGDTVEFSAIPMLGAVVGRTDGIAPGCTLSLTWKRLSWYSENEYVVVPSDHTENFFYNWSELTLDAAEWASVGIATQRTRAYDTDRDLQRGVMARFTVSRVSVTAYWLNPGSDDDFAILSVGFEY
jgi:hypothetical protein